jgi:hypothetical protein
MEYRRGGGRSGVGARAWPSLCPDRQGFSLHAAVQCAADDLQ